MIVAVRKTEIYIIFGVVAGASLLVIIAGGIGRWIEARDEKLKADLEKIEWL
jgi:hypothetical protein